MKQLFGKRRKWLQLIGELTRLRKAPVPKEVECELFKVCTACGKSSSRKEWKRKLNCCPHCAWHGRISSKERIELLLDEGYQNIDSPAVFHNPLNFPGYEEKWQSAANQSGSDEAIHFVKGTIHEQPCVIGVMESAFLMASMGHIVGERIVNAFRIAKKEHLPVIIICCSGGARMQEGIYSLMQMRRTAAVIQEHHDAGRLLISVMTDPTTGGVSASFASLGDIILAEPGALIGFAGPRVIKETIQCDLPQGFQLAEFQERHGFVDRIVKRERLKEELGLLLALHSSKQGEKSSSVPKPASQNLTKSVLTPYERVQEARKQERIKPRELISRFCTDIVELKGDRYFGNDASIRGGLARLGGIPITFLYTEKGEDLNDQIYHHFGMAHPEGYRKAARLICQAEQFRRPILTVIDTPGAYPGIGAEERGQGEAIASNLALMSSLTVPLLTVITGEAGSGGALGLACADRLYMLENAIYSILSPEGFSVILWKDSTRVKEAAEAMRLTAEDMKKFGVCDQVFPDNLAGLKEQLLYDLSQPSLKRKQLFDLKYFKEE